MIVQLTRQAKKDLAQFDRKDWNRILAALYKLQDDPRGCDLKKLQGEHPDKWRLRVGDARIILIPDKQNDALYVMSIEQRKDAYR